MPVTLLPPIRQGTFRTPTRDPLLEGPRYVRGSGNSRWHRPRNGFWPCDGEDRLVWGLWCGPSVSEGGKAGPVLHADDIPAGEPVCGTCVGRALGAGQDELPAGLPALLFCPRWIEPPARCPGSGTQLCAPVDSARGNIYRCLVCSQLEATRAIGSRWDSRWGLVAHPPGPDLTAPCVWHAWHHLTDIGDGRAGCACGWHQRRNALEPTPAGGTP